jgi:hypothetical protein
MGCQTQNLAQELFYYPQASISTCALCGGAVGTVNFKGKLVCEDCCEVVKDLYQTGI